MRTRRKIDTAILVPAAGYAIFDPTAEAVTFLRVPYDNFAAARKIRQAGLPDWLAERIERGV